MSNIVTQYSRLSHHTITPSGTTFTVPVQEDFTLSPSGWTTTDLALSEIGVNETDNKAYIRIGSNINEIFFNDSTLSGASNQVAYYDNTGKLTSDSGFTHSVTGGTMFYVHPTGDIKYGVYNGQIFDDARTTGSALIYNDNSGGFFSTNAVGVIESIDPTSPTNLSFLLWQNTETQSQSLVGATQLSGTPLILLQSISYLDTGATQSLSTSLTMQPDSAEFGYTDADNNFFGLGISGTSIGITGNTLIQYQTDSGATFELIVGDADNFNGGVGLSYRDTTEGKNYQNIIGVLSGASDSDVNRNSSILGWSDNNSDNSAFIQATSFSGTPVIYMSVNSGNTYSVIGIQPNNELISVTDGNFTATLDASYKGATIMFQSSSGGTSSGFDTSDVSGNTVAQIISNDVEWNWATSDGVSGSTLTTDGNGNLSFKTITTSSSSNIIGYIKGYDLTSGADMPITPNGGTYYITSMLFTNAWYSGDPSGAGAFVIYDGTGQTGNQLVSSTNLLPNDGATGSTYSLVVANNGGGSINGITSSASTLYCSLLYPDTTNAGTLDVYIFGQYLP